MKKFRALPLLSIIVTSSLLMTGITPKALAEAGSAKVYIICLSGVPGWSFPNQTVDIQKVKDGAIHALSPKESTGIPLVHPKYGNTPPFYSVTYYVVTDWVLYKNIIESYKGVIVINTHGEILPVPSGYSTPVDWVDKIADAMLHRRVSWVHTAGYPFYWFWWEGATDKTQWGDAGFKQLMSHINKDNVTCEPPGSQTEKIRLSDAAENQLLNGGYPKFEEAFWVWRGRPLKASDFKDYLVMAIHGVDYYTTAVIAFAKPGARFNPSNQYGFGSYVHIGTYQTHDADKVPTEADYWRGYIGAVAAVWAEMQAFHGNGMKTGSLSVYPYAELTIFARPVISSYRWDTDYNSRIVRVSFFIYGLLRIKKGTSTYINYVDFRLDNTPSDCQVNMITDLSRSGKDSGLVLQGVYTSGSAPIAETILFGLDLASIAIPQLAPITLPLGGIMLWCNWVSPNLKDKTRGVDNWDSKVEFTYNPHITRSDPDDGCLYDEFESIITIEVKVTQTNRAQWSIVPLRWIISMYTSSPDAPVSYTVGGISIAAYNGYNEDLPFKATVFFEDFEDDLSSWNIGDSNSLADQDYWGIFTAKAYSIVTDLFYYNHMHTAWCAQVGNNSIENKPNTEAVKYDKGMEAYLRRQIDLRPYQSAELSYTLEIYIKTGDYLTVEYYDTVWHTLRNYTNPNEHFYNEPQIPIPNTTQYIRSRFVSNGDNNILEGAFLDNIEIKAVIPNDAGKGIDAGDYFSEATTIEVSESTINYAGYLSDDDWYKFNVINKQRIYVYLRYPPEASFTVTLHDPQGNPRATASNSFNYRTDCSGNWCIKITNTYGFGQYDFDIRVYGPVYTFKVLTQRTSGWQIVGIGVEINGQDYESPVVLEVYGGTYTVTVDREYYRPYSKFTFQYWDNGNTNPTRIVNVNDDTTIIAYYTEEVYGGCPTLYVWNGSEYVEEGLLNIHSPEGIDKIAFRILENKPTPTNGKYLFKLVEGTAEGSHSFIDCVKLYAIDKKGIHKCNLTSAIHSQYGNVLTALQASDDIRTDTLPEQQIWLTFTAPQTDRITFFLFTIEGYNSKPIPR